MTVETFPQRYVTETKKPTAGDLIKQGVNRADPTEVIIATVYAAYPNITVGGLYSILLAEMEALDEKKSKNMAEAEWIALVVDICGPFKENFKTIGEMLKAASSAGDKRANPILGRLYSPENDKLEGELKAAVALDPYWQEVAEGEYGCQPSQIISLSSRRF